jgi:outer membrane lipoprotein-sorting protein
MKSQTKSFRDSIILAGLIISLTSASLLFAGEKTADAYRELPVSEQDVLMQRITGTLQSVKSLKADFAQERHLSLFLDVLSARGRLYFVMPDRLRWELSEPYASVLVFNGGNVAKFVREDGKLVKMKPGMEDMLQEVLQQITSIMRGNFKKLRDVYDISLFQGKDYRLSMRPLSAGLSKIIKSLDLSIDPGSSHVTTITIREPQGDYIEIKFSGEEENRTLDNRLFDLNSPLPPGETTGNKNK